MMRTSRLINLYWNHVLRLHPPGEFIAGNIAYEMSVLLVL